MMEATPESIDGSELTVAFDSDYEQLHCMMVERDLQLLNRRLRDISGDPNAEIFCVRRAGLASPAQIRRKESVEEMKKAVARNPLVAEVVGRFSGRVVDVHDLSGQTEHD